MQRIDEKPKRMHLSAACAFVCHMWVLRMHNNGLCLYWLTVCCYSTEPCCFSIAIVRPEFADRRLTGCFNEKRTLIFIWPRPLTVSAIRDVFGPAHPRSPRSPASGSEQQKTVVLSIYSSDKHSSLRDVGNCRMKVDYFLVRPSSPLSHRQIVRAVSTSR
jgi:hypothetical protein